MLCERPYPSRMVLLLTFSMMSGQIPSLVGQEYSPVVEDRVDSGIEQAPLVETAPEAEKPEGWDLGLVISAAYDDNIFLSSKKPESDFVTRVAPTIAFAKGGEMEGEGFFVKAGYRPTGVLYSENSSENRVDHQAIAAAGWRGKLTRITYSGVIQQLGDATADTGRPTDRLEFENEIRGAWSPREKITLEGAVGYRQSDYADPDLFDSEKTYGEIAIRYAYSPKTELGIIYQIGRFKVDGTGPQDTQQVTGNIVWQPREKIRVDLEAGAEYRKFDNGSSVNPVLEGRLGWLPRKETELFVTAYMREEASAFYAGQNYGVKGITAGVSHQLGPKWTATLEGGLEEDTYELVSGSAAGGRKDRIWFIRPAFKYRMSADSDLSLFYRVSDNASTDPAFGYDQQMIGLELNHRF